jgi:PHD/YefM family antitoxin component YafN of YafNO toxin-antitoxin module
MQTSIATPVNCEISDRWFLRHRTCHIDFVPNEFEYCTTQLQMEEMIVQYYEMPTATLDISEARKQLNSLDQRLRDERVIVVTRHNKKAFAVVDLEYWSAVMETIEILSDPEAMRMLAQSVEDIRAGRLHDHESVEQELG